MKILYKAVFLVCIPAHMQSTLTINKVIVWGYKLHSHTHSYIHEGFYKASLFLGYKTYWFDDHDDISGIDFNNALFITMGSDANKKMPLIAYIPWATDLLPHEVEEMKQRVIQKWGKKRGGIYAG